MINSTVYMISWMILFSSVHQFTYIYKCCLHCALNIIYECFIYFKVTQFKSLYKWFNSLCLSFLWMKPSDCTCLLWPDSKNIFWRIKETIPASLGRGHYSAKLIWCIVYILDDEDKTALYRLCSFPAIC